MSLAAIYTVQDGSGPDVRKGGFECEYLYSNGEYRSDVGDNALYLDGCTPKCIDISSR